MKTNPTPEGNPETLRELRSALERIERQRAEAGLQAAEKKTLEEASTALREAERRLIRQNSDNRDVALKASAEKLTELAKEIRKRARKLSATARTLERINLTIRQALELTDKIK
jgi:uncharacterized membrane protein